MVSESFFCWSSFYPINESALGRTHVAVPSARPSLHFLLLSILMASYSTRHAQEDKTLLKTEARSTGHAQICTQGRKVCRDRPPDRPPRGSSIRQMGAIDRPVDWSECRSCAAQLLVDRPVDPHDGSGLFSSWILDLFLIRIKICWFYFLCGFSVYIKRNVVPIDHNLLSEVNYIGSSRVSLFVRFVRLSV